MPETIHRNVIFDLQRPCQYISKDLMMDERLCRSGRIIPMSAN